MLLKDTISDYLLFIKHEQNVTRSTYAGYASWLRNFLRWLADQGIEDPSLDSFSTPILRKFLYHLSEKGYRPRTIRGVFHPLRGLGEYLLKEGMIAVNPVKAIRMPKLDAAIRLTVTKEQVSALLDACSRIYPKRRSALAKSLLCVLLYGGLRREELCNLKVSDFDSGSGSVLVRSGKGRKSRRVYLCDDGIEAVKAWLEHREKDSS